MTDQPLPGDRQESQPTVLVSGQARALLHRVPFQLLAGRASAGDGAVVVSTRASPTVLVGRLTDGPRGLDPARLAVVDARGGGDTPDVGWYRHVASDAEPGTLDDAVVEALDWLGGAGIERRHFLYDTLASAGTPDGDDAYDRAYRIAMTVGAEDGLAIFALDAGVLPEETVEELTHLFDVHLQLREHHGDTELRWTGLLGASDGWISRGETDQSVGGFR
jgi:hypothetical protein